MCVYTSKHSLEDAASSSGHGRFLPLHEEGGHASLPHTGDGTHFKDSIPSIHFLVNYTEMLPLYTQNETFNAQYVFDVTL